MMFVGLNAINTHALIALERVKVSRMTISKRQTLQKYPPPKKNVYRVKFLDNNPGDSKRNLLLMIVTSLSVSCLFTLYPFMSGHPKYKVGANDYYWTLDYSDPSAASQLFVGVLLFTEYMLPLSAICASYITIAIRIKRTRANAVSLIRS